MSPDNTALIAELLAESRVIQKGAWPQMWAVVMEQAALALIAASRDREEWIECERALESANSWAARTEAAEARLRELTPPDVAADERAGVREAQRYLRSNT